MKRNFLAVVAAFVCMSAHGQLTKVNGHRLFLDCQGSVKGPAVILIAGGHGTTETWSKVQQPISQFARVCSYDRLGLGQSDSLAPGQEQSVDEIVTDLEMLLKKANVEPPYILVAIPLAACMPGPSTNDLTLK